MKATDGHVFLWAFASVMYKCTKSLPDNDKTKNYFRTSTSELPVPPHLAVGQLIPGLFAVREDLPEDHAEAPDVALRCELPVHDAFRGHPADWQHCASTNLRRKTFSQMSRYFTTHLWLIANADIHICTYNFGRRKHMMLFPVSGSRHTCIITCVVLSVCHIVRNMKLGLGRAVIADDITDE